MERLICKCGFALFEPEPIAGLMLRCMVCLKHWAPIGDAWVEVHYKKTPFYTFPKSDWLPPKEEPVRPEDEVIAAAALTVTRAVMATQETVLAEAVKRSGYGLEKATEVFGIERDPTVVGGRWVLHDTLAGTWVVEVWGMFPRFDPNADLSSTLHFGIMHQWNPKWEPGTPKGEP